MSHNHSLAEANLTQAADAMERTGWTVARLIAASVASGSGQGARTSRPAAEKLSVHRAADLMSKSHHTIKAYLIAWNAAAANGLCVPSADLTPEDGWTATLPDADWTEYYTNTKPRGVGIDQVEKRAAEDAEYRERLARIVNGGGTPSPIGEAIRTISEAASSDHQMDKIATSGDAHRFIRRAIERDPKAQQAARQALDEVYENSPKPYPNEPKSSPADDATDLIYELRKLHKGIDNIVNLVNSGAARVTDEQAVLREISWLRTALGYIEDGVKSDNLADQVADFLAQVN